MSKTTKGVLHEHTLGIKIATLEYCLKLIEQLPLKNAVASIESLLAESKEELNHAD